MSVALYMDENVHGAITRGLRLRGVDVLTVQDEGLESTPDPQVLDRAAELRRVLVSQDTDLLIEAVQRQRAEERFIGVIYAAQDPLAVGRYIEDLEVIAKATDLEEYANRVEHLPL